ncbi:MarR family winged helix-turn-helix transcriptional regulator [Niabella soli]|uniref:MarR family transcriptional regulator n=1 Tax=Niabella soli DSM 19437 TaxID=929713 RepID=W0EYR9_9BACT|nr:MarR family transcriptional regulator [Niabella soli]AHF14344.1 MarR family transcriptional regulator [Niabella soli DSM 19437]
MEVLNNIVFYSLDKAIKSYRQFAQKQLKAAGFTITIDQWLVLKAIEEDNSISQQEIAARVFKDVASITRIIELLVTNNLLSRHFHPADRRRFELKLTPEGKKTMENLKPYIQANRKKALKGIAAGDISRLQKTLDQIIKNVSS